MSLPVGPRPHPSLLKDPPLTHTASAAQVATSRATPEIPPPLGGTWAVGNRVAPAGKGHRGYRSHERVATFTARSFSEVGGLGAGGTGLGDRLVLKTQNQGKWRTWRNLV